MTTGITIKAKAQFRQTRRTPAVDGDHTEASVCLGRIPRVTRLLALAHRFEALIQSGKVRDYADLARLGHVTRARVTQIMNLLNLAPDLQEQILVSPDVCRGKDRLTERQLRQVVALPDWKQQRNVWTTAVEPTLRLM